MGDNHKQKDYYDRRDGRPEMKYHGTMGVTLFSWFFSQESVWCMFL